MALIKCPECGSEISDKASACIHCGYPLAELKNEKPKLTGENIVTIYPRRYDLEEELKLIMDGEEIKASENIRNIIGLGVRNSYKLVDEIKRLGEIPKEFSFERTTDELKCSKSKNNTPKCPTCGSANIEKISLGKKAVSGAMFGLFSSNIRNTFQCNNCGYKW